MNRDGFVNLNKPSGMTSFRAVAAVRRLFGVRPPKAGHGGTLDPLASGVLPIGVGRATRLLSFVGEGAKTYRCRARLGVATDTYDSDGRIVAVAEVPPYTVAEIAGALCEFRGEIEQLPPPFSALKEKGVPFYDLARRGLEVPQRPRRVHIYRLELLDWAPPDLWIEVECGSGTYIRSLVHDLGQRLGCGAHVVELVRTRVGDFALDDAITLEALTGAAPERLADALLPLDFVVRRLPILTLPAAAAAALRQGQAVKAEGDAAAPGPHRVYDESGRFIALAQRDTAGDWRPIKVLLAWEPAALVQQQ